MGQLTIAGYVPERLDAILVTLDQGFRAIYGDDINTDPDTPDGQMIGLIGQIKADLEELGEAVYRALDPDHASGAWLEQRTAYAGITRRRASYSYLRSATLTGVPGSIIPSGSLVEDESKAKWQLVDTQTIDATGTVRGDFRSTELGSFGLSQTAKLKMLTVVLGWAGVTLNAPAEAGEEEERDPVLRSRFYKSRARGAQNSPDGIEANVGQLPDVREVICLENYTNVTDANGVPAHSINAIVDGGIDADIARLIFEHKTAGTGMRGEVHIEVIDPRGRTRPVWFDRPTLIDCAAHIGVHISPGYTAIDIDAIKAAIVNTQFDIGRDVQRTRLYSPINTVPGFWVSTLEIGKVGGVLSEANIEIDVRSKARFTATDIEVVVYEL